MHDKPITMHNHNKEHNRGEKIEKDLCNNIFHKIEDVKMGLAKKKKRTRVKGHYRTVGKKTVRVKSHLRKV